MSKAQAQTKNKPPTSGEIYLLDHPRLRSSNHPHYCLVVRVNGTHAIVNFFSSKFDLFKDDKDLAIYDTDTEFVSTGLIVSSYLISEDYALVRVPFSNLFALGASVGKVTGHFKKRVEEWWGESL